MNPLFLFHSPAIDKVQQAMRGNPAKVHEHFEVKKSTLNCQDCPLLGLCRVRKYKAVLSHMHCQPGAGTPAMARLLETLVSTLPDPTSPLDKAVEWKVGLVVSLYLGTNPCILCGLDLQVPQISSLQQSPTFHPTALSRGDVGLGNVSTRAARSLAIAGISAPG